MRCVLGIDVATTGVKVLLVSEAGTVISSATREYPLLAPKPNWSEQDPRTWWEATVSAVRRCLDKACSFTGSRIEVISVGLSGQMHGSVFLDSHGVVLRPAILWNDQRTEVQCNEITRTVGFTRLMRG